MVFGLERRRLAAVIQASKDGTAAGAPPLQPSPRRRSSLRYSAACTRFFGPNAASRQARQPPVKPAFTSLPIM